MRRAAELISARLARPSTSRVQIAAPGDRLGIIHVRARPLHQRRVVEGSGGLDAFIVRPATPSFPALKPDRKLYPVRSTARLTLRTAPGAPRSWAAVLVRDLAAHAGEYPFRLEFLARAFDRAILDPGTKAAETLLRAFVREVPWFSIRRFFFEGNLCVAVSVRELCRDERGEYGRCYSRIQLQLSDLGSGASARHYLNSMTVTLNPLPVVEWELYQ